ncbi:MAG: ATP-binding cassette domain-containing protein [Eubacterium sp.]|nr:ATP-binding cassette domain-containing protein [Eubacterium sp.]
MEKEYAVEAQGISKVYKLYQNPGERLKDFVFAKSYGKEFYALKNLSFQVKKGDIVGLVGLNGSGKSTLAEILGGLIVPTQGNIRISGTPTVVAISAGLNNQLTGMENIELKGLMTGLTMKQIHAIRDEIVAFADIGEHIYQPVKTYSSGMKARLGFAVSVNILSDILIIDEALSVGDPTFMQKCMDKMQEFRESGRTIFFVSHSLEQIKQFCRNVIWLEYGRMRAFGTVREIVPEYYRFVVSFNEMTKEEKEKYRTERLGYWEKGGL